MKSKIVTRRFLLRFVRFVVIYILVSSLSPFWLGVPLKYMVYYFENKDSKINGLGVRQFLSHFKTHETAHDRDNNGDLDFWSISGSTYEGGDFSFCFFDTNEDDLPDCVNMEAELHKEHVSYVQEDTGFSDTEGRQCFTLESLEREDVVKYTYLDYGWDSIVDVMILKKEGKEEQYYLCYADIWYEVSPEEHSCFSFTDPNAPVRRLCFVDGKWEQG